MRVDIAGDWLRRRAILGLATVDVLSAALITS